MNYTPTEILKILKFCTTSSSLCEASMAIRATMKDEDDFKHLPLLSDWAEIRLKEIELFNKKSK